MKRINLSVILIILATTIVAGCATAPKHPALEQSDLPELIPVRKFFLSGKSNYDYRVSPDGKRLAWIAPKKFRRTIFFRTIGQDDTEAIDTHSSRSIYNHRWLQDSRRLLYMQDQEGNENHHIYLADTKQPNQKPVNLTPFPETRAGIQQIIRSDPDHILIVHNRRDKTVFDLYRVNLITYRQTLLAQNPGDVISWVTDQEGRLRGRVRKTRSDKFSIELKGLQRQSWKALIDWDFDDAVQILGFTPDDRGMWLLSNRGREFLSLVRLDLNSGKEVIIYQAPNVDVGWVAISAVTRNPFLAFSCPDYPRIHFFDSVLAAELKASYPTKPTGLSLTSMDNQERLYTFSLYNDKGVQHYLFNRQSGERKLLGQGTMAEYAEELSTVEAIQFQSRDGLDLHGYLTLPKGTAGQQLPMVLLVHGGPWNRDWWSYNSVVQFLVNRGYAVLQINYRGSRGYGRSFMEAGVDEFAGKMQTDLIDGVQWAIAKGIADPNRIAIAGASYGGYATLVGLSFTPDTFACGVDIFGPSNLVSLLENFPDYWKPWMRFWHKYVGDPGNPEDRRQMEAKSPLFRVDQITSPLLIAQGANDVRCTQLESDQMVAALQSAGKEVEYILFPNEGHSLTHWKNVLVLTRKMEDFLAEHLGGRSAGFDYYELGLLIF
jgi:dipeptidyl aminopeptidase/acylaminoacyl peptidase